MPKRDENTDIIRLKDLCIIKTNFPDADFWVQRRGTKENVGKPTKEFNPENIGIKVTATDILNPQYLYYVFMHLHATKKWESVATGTLNLVNIKTSDVANIPVGKSG